MPRVFYVHLYYGKPRLSRCFIHSFTPSCDLDIALETEHFFIARFYDFASELCKPASPMSFFMLRRSLTRNLHTILINSNFKSNYCGLLSAYCTPFSLKKITHLESYKPFRCLLNTREPASPNIASLTNPTRQTEK